MEKLKTNMKVNDKVITKNGYIGTIAYEVDSIRAMEKRWCVYFTDNKLGDFYESELKLYSENDTDNKQELIKNCETCRYLQVINKEPIFAYCRRNGWNFRLWDNDTRCAVCGNYETKHD